MARSRGSTSEASPATRSDAYTGLLLIALLAQIAGVVFFYLDWSQYPKKKPDLPPKQVAPSVPLPGAQQGGQAGAQQGAQAGAQTGVQVGAQQGGPPGGAQMAGGPGGGAGMTGNKGP